MVESGPGKTLKKFFWEKKRKQPVTLADIISRTNMH